MSTNLWKAFVVVACLAFLALPAAARRPGAASTGSCANLDVAVSTATATAGISTVGVYGPITNCSSRRNTFTVVDTITSACGQSATITSARLTFRGLDTQLVSSSYRLPAGTCAGTASVTRSVYDGGQMLASDSAVLTVLPPQ